MPRPRNKKELFALSKNNFEKLNEYIESLPDDEVSKDFPKGTLNRNIRDVLAHLHHWHLLFLDWYVVGMKGGKPEIPAKGYTFKTTPDLNREIWKKYRNTDLKKIRSMLHKSFSEIHTIIRNHTDKELFEKKKYKWTGSTSLGAYIISATSSHYDWALKLIKRAKR